MAVYFFGELMAKKAALHRRQVTLIVKVDAPDHLSDDDVATYINRMLDSGYQDAVEASGDYALDPEFQEEASLAASLEIGEPEVLKEKPNG